MQELLELVAERHALRPGRALSRHGCLAGILRGCPTLCTDCRRLRNARPFIPARLLCHTATVRRRRARTCDSRGLGDHHEHPGSRHDDGATVSMNGRRRVASAALLGALTLLAAGCATLPKGFQREPSAAWDRPQETQLGRSLAEAVAQHPGSSGFHILGSGMDAFVARMALAQAAERTLDLQYYIFHTDFAGKLILHAALEAAERGVRVRILVDDTTAKGRDAGIAVLSSHPLVEVRVFNPSAGRSSAGWMLNAASDFDRVNQPHAQQDVRGRQPGGHHRREEHRRRVLRRPGGGELRRHGPPRRGAGGAGPLPELRPVLEQRVGVPDRGVPRGRERPRRPPQGPRGAGRAPCGGAGLGLRAAVAGVGPAAAGARSQARVPLGPRAALRRPAGEGRGRARARWRS